MSTQRRVRQAYEIKHMSWIRLGTDMEEDASSNADEAQCVIVRGERREVIPLADANDAQKVKVLFGPAIACESCIQNGHGKLKFFFILLQKVKVIFSYCHGK